MDLALPFGLATSPFIFNMFAEGLHWILEHVYAQSLVHYLDDFLLIGGDDNSIFQSVCNYIGFEEKSSKSLDGTVVDFTGIELDSDCMEMRLPNDKHTRALNAVDNILQRGSTSFEELQSTIGFLSFCARAVPLGRPFLCNLFNFLYILAASIKHPLARRRLSSEATRDLKWWFTFLRNWHGVRLIQQHRDNYFIYTDASGSKGIGGWSGPDAFSTRMPRRHRNKHINWKEAYAVLYALASWGEELSGSQVTIMCDNEAIVHAINKRTVRGDAINPLQLIYLTAALYNIKIISCWLSSEENWIADALSRFQVSRLANHQLDKLFNLHRRHDGSPMFRLRQKLQHFYGTDLPHLQGTYTTALGTSTSISAASTVIQPKPPFPQHLNHCRTGSPTLSKRRNQKQSHSTSQRSKANTSTIDTIPKSLTTPESSECSTLERNDCLAHNLLKTEQISQDHYYCRWSDPLTAIDTTTSISLPHSQSHSQPSSDQPNSHGNPGTPAHRTSYTYQEDQSHSPTTEYSSTYPNQKQINSEKDPSSHSPKQTMNAALLVHSNAYSQNTHFQTPVLFSLDLPAHSTETGLNHLSNERSSTQETTQPPTLDIPFAEVQQIRQSKQAYLNLTSSNWDDGNLMQSNDTSQQSHHKHSASLPTVNFTWPPRHRDPSFDSLDTYASPAAASQSCVSIWPSNEDARHPLLSLGTLGYCGFPLLLLLVAYSLL